MSYVLPLRAGRPQLMLASHLAWLGEHFDDVIVVDGSDAEVFAAHAGAFPVCVRHFPVDPSRVTPMGKVGGVLTGIECSRHAVVMIDDDDVGYDDRALREVERLGADAEIVRPQNFFSTLSWHAWWDTVRTLLNRATGGDWPGTLVVHRGALRQAGGMRVTCCSRTSNSFARCALAVRASASRSAATWRALRPRPGTSAGSESVRPPTNSPDPRGCSPSSRCSPPWPSAAGAR